MIDGTYARDRTLTDHRLIAAAGRNSYGTDSLLGLTLYTRIPDAKNWGQQKMVRGLASLQARDCSGSLRAYAADSLTVPSRIVAGSRG